MTDRDPWMMMAIDAQFVPYTRLLLYMPTTFTYLMYHEKMEEVRNDHAVDGMMNYLWRGVEDGYYAEALTEIIWPGEDVEDVMLLSLGYPDVLWEKFIDYIENRYYAEDKYDE